jgi:tetratricopeptide (TPR) repeat protein
MALQILSGIHPPELQVTFYSLDYVTGRCKLNHLEPDANIYLEKYLAGYPGLDFKKDVCNRLSYYYLIQGDLKKYHSYKSKVMTIGQEIRDRDQEAALESQSGIVPQVALLKARLLCDGGYFDEALAIMKSIDPEQLTEKSHQLEYHYRLGRILQLSGKPEKAIPELTFAYDEGKSEPYTYATRAAFFLGRIYEDRKDYAQSNDWYERSIDAFSPAHTTEGVKDAAEKGEKRIKGKF